MFKLRPPKAAQVVSGQAQQRVRETNTEEDRETHQKDSKKMVWKTSNFNFNNWSKWSYVTISKVEKCDLFFKYNYLHYNAVHKQGTTLFSFNFPAAGDDRFHSQRQWYFAAGVCAHVKGPLGTCHQPWFRPVARSDWHIPSVQCTVLSRQRPDQAAVLWTETRGLSIDASGPPSPSDRTTTCEFMLWTSGWFAQAEIATPSPYLQWPAFSIK